MHLVVAEAAKFRTSDLVAAGLGGGEVHVDRQAGHGVLFETHLRNKETVDEVVRAQNEFHFAPYGHFHNPRDYVVLGRRILRVETQGRFSTGGRVFQLRLRQAKFSIPARVAEIPGELHAALPSPKWDFQSGSSRRRG